MGVPSDRRRGSHHRERRPVSRGGGQVADGSARTGVLNGAVVGHVVGIDGVGSSQPVEEAATVDDLAAVHTRLRRLASTVEHEGDVTMDDLW